MKQRRTVLTLFLGFLFVHSGAHAQWQVDGTALSTAMNNQVSPALVSDGAGGAIAAWQDLRSGTYDIYAQRVNAAGVVQWLFDAGLCTFLSNQFSPKIISDGAGGAIVTWQDFRTGTNLDIYAQRVNAAGALLWTTDGIPVCTDNGSQSVPTIAPDGAGGALVAWHDNRDGNLDIFVQRLDPAGVPQWTLDGVSVCTAVNDQSFPTIASDGAGGAIVTWYDHRSGTNDDIYARRVNAAGVPQWTADGVALCTAVNSQRDPAIIADGAGGAIVTWDDLRSNFNDVYAQRVNGAGVVQWTGDGVALCTAASSQDRAKLVSDGAGGAIVTWQDARGTDVDIYARRVNATGAVQWTPNGVALTTAVYDQFSPTIVSDGAGGAIVTWYDGRSGTDYDIYAQRVNATGVVQWAPGGADLSTADNDQLSPIVVADGAGGAIVAWYDIRNGTDYDIYAQRVNAWGFPPTGIGDTPRLSSLTVLQNHPNPFSASTEFEVRIAEPSDVAIDVYDVAGRRVSGAMLKGVRAGWREIAFDARYAAGQPLPSGVYFYRVRAGGETITKKMVIAR